MKIQSNRIRSFILIFLVFFITTIFWGSFYIYCGYEGNVIISVKISEDSDLNAAVVYLKTKCFGPDYYYVIGPNLRRIILPHDPELITPDELSNHLKVNLKDWKVKIVDTKDFRLEYRLSDQEIESLKEAVETYNEAMKMIKTSKKE